jgi:hypothetical protein
VAIGRNLQEAATVSDAVLSNSILDNAGLGIDPASDGVTPDTLGNPHTGPNNLLSTPVSSGLEGPSLSATAADATFDTSAHSRDAQVL